MAVLYECALERDLELFDVSPSITSTILALINSLGSMKSGDNTEV